MTEKITAFVLDVTRHNDRHNVVTLYSRTRGRISFLSPCGSGKSGKLRQARLLPLAVIDADINFRQTSELQKLGAFSLHHVWSDIYFHPVKRLVALFLSEFLNRLLRASMPDEALWDYIFNSLSLLDRMEKGVPDFHIAFLSSLLPFAGIQPDPSDFRPGCVFDMQAGVFTSRVPPHRDFAEGRAAFMASLLCRINFANDRALRLNGELRLRLLEGLLRYYAIHYPGTSNLKSLDVMHELFT